MGAGVLAQMSMPPVYWSNLRHNPNSSPSIRSLPQQDSFRILSSTMALALPIGCQGLRKVTSVSGGRLKSLAGKRFLPAHPTPQPVGHCSHNWFPLSVTPQPPANFLDARGPPARRWAQYPVSSTSEGRAGASFKNEDGETRQWWQRTALADS